MPFAELVISAVEIPGFKMLKVLFSGCVCDSYVGQLAKPKGIHTKWKIHLDEAHNMPLLSLFWFL